MTRFTIVGLSLLAALAFSGIASPSAFAGEYGLCVKAAKVNKKPTGAFEDKGCTKRNLQEEGEYNWKSYNELTAAQQKEFVFTDKNKSKTFELKTSIGNVICKKNTSSGSVTGGKENNENVDKIEFTDCISSTFKNNCWNFGETGDKEKFPDGGTINTNMLASELIDYQTEGPSHEEPAEGEVWNAYSASAGNEGRLASFECVGAPNKYWITGSVSGVISPLSVNKMDKKTVIEFAEGKGEQDLTFWTYKEDGEEIGLHAALVGEEEIEWTSPVEIRACNEVAAGAKAIKCPYTE